MTALLLDLRWVLIGGVLMVYYLYLLGRLHDLGQRWAYWTGLSGTVVFIGSHVLVRFAKGPEIAVHVAVGILGGIIAVACEGSAGSMIPDLGRGGRCRSVGR